MQNTNNRPDSRPDPIDHRDSHSIRGDVTPISNVFIMMSPRNALGNPANVAKPREKRTLAGENKQYREPPKAGPTQSGTKCAISRSWTEGLHEAADDQVNSPPHGLSGKVITMSKLPLRSIAVTAVLFFLLHLATVNLNGLAQEETLPAQPGSEETTEQPEVLTRGPVHEAFAEQINNDPEAGVLIPNAPPEPIGEVPPEFKPEGENVIWIPGYWSWDDEREDHVWVSGVWRVPPQDRRWVPGYWNNTDGGYHWISGFWISTSKTSVQYQEAPPSSLEAGPTSAAPDTNHFWVPGVWQYRTTYRWRPGYWRPFRADWIWIPAHYIWTPRGTVFVDGYWDYRMPRRGQLFAPVYIRHHRYRHARYRYRPSCVINLGSIGMHLFVRPSYHHYYFGDYYGTTYSSRNFYASFRFHSSGFGCDPFLTYYQWHFARQGINYRQRLYQSHSYFVRNQRQRPARTLRSQTNIIVNQQNNTNINVNVLGRSLRDVARDTRSPQKIVRLANEQRSTHQQDLQKLREISTRRRDHERSPKGLPASKLAQQDGPAKNTVAQADRIQPRKDLALPPARSIRQSAGPRVSNRGEELRRKLAETKSAVKPPTVKTTPARPAPQKVAPGKITRPAVTSSQPKPIVGPLPATTPRATTTRPTNRGDELRRKLAEKKSAVKPPTVKTTPARPAPQKVAPGKITRPAVTSSQPKPIVGPLPARTTQPARTKQLPSSVGPIRTSPAVKARVPSSVTPTRKQPAPTASRGSSTRTRQVPSRTPARTAPASKSRTAPPVTSRSKAIPGRSSSVTRPAPSKAPTASVRRSVPSSSRSTAPRSAPVRKSVSPAPTSRKTTSRPSSSRVVGPRPSSSSRTVAPRPTTTKSPSPRSRVQSSSSRSSSSATGRRSTARTTPSPRKK